MLNINDKNLLTSITARDFNVISNNWWLQDSTCSQGSITDTITSTSGYHQLVSWSTNSTSSSTLCIDLIFTSNQLLSQNSVLKILLWCFFL